MVEPAEVSGKIQSRLRQLMIESGGKKVDVIFAIRYTDTTEVNRARIPFSHHRNFIMQLCDGRDDKLN